MAGLIFFINIGATLLLMRPLGLIGFAVANVFSMAVHSGLLHWNLSRGRPDMAATTFLRSISSILLSVLGMSAVTLAGWKFVAGLFSDPKWIGLSVVFAVIPASVCVYFLLLGFLRFEDAESMRDVLRKAFRF